ncbi:putative DNA-binding transcriptional regulator YafY [Pseudacidovorax intermedius]|uniref:Putative DNA-binding transcriptional regulator YafY n=1 Tax=Pseudacidovorax intermedius TaxID=433924 RepID=A0A370FL60_9BURK|nr:YafY family protein [Pseudacidovorax intermedius]RDI25308.1 putative DNA-binding transcriptional regulator YafY [Pseudacidovorax intermedius]
MRRADRLFQIVQLIRGRRLTTAAFLAGRLEVSERTVYRDIADLQRQGVPLEGEAGIGYRLGRGFDLPPLMFTQDEARALVAAARLAQSWVDPALGDNIDGALGKILSVLPPTARAAAESLALYAPAIALDDVTRVHLRTLREAVQARRKLWLDYRDEGGKPSERQVRPLGCFYWGKVWTLAAWCELRQDFRAFRMDRIRDARMLEEGFRDEPGRTLADLRRRIEANCADDRSI